MAPHTSWCGRILLRDDEVGYNRSVPSYPGVGDHIGRFRVLAQLGAGGMGVVFDALEENLDRRVALKVIAPMYADHPDFRERFSREARLLASLDSPQVVQVYAHGEEDGYLYIATQLIPDGDLGQMVGRWGPAPQGKAVDLIAQVAGGLSDAHAAGLVHRDIKPANVLVRRRGAGVSASVSAYLGDFGIARRVDAESTRVGGGGGAAGTPSYMAPELHHGAAASAGSDIYSLGCLLWVTLTGSAPYAGATEFEVVTAHLNAPVPQLAGTGHLVHAINDVLRRSMAKSPTERYAHASDLRDDLRRAAALTGDPGFHAMARALAAPAPAGVPRQVSGPVQGPVQGQVSGPVPPPPAPSYPTPVPAARTAAPARRRTGLWVGLGLAAALAIGGGVTAALVAGGGDDAPSSADPTPEPPEPPESPDPASSSPTVAGFADQEPTEILRAAEKEMKVLDTVRIAGNVVEGGERIGVDLTITSTGDCAGTIAVGGGSAQLRRIGADTWFKADEDFWIASTDAGQGPFIAATVGDRWVLFPPEEAEEFASVCDLDDLLEATNSTVAVETLGTGSIDGQDVVKVDTGETTSSGEPSVASVAVGEPHYILRLDGGSEGSFGFSAFDEPFTTKAPPPSDVFDLAGLG
jgi:hypothetical protein